MNFPIDVILFDFDGVILESVDVKGWAFGKLFEEFPMHKDKIIAYHYENGGMSRFDKIRNIYKDILNKEITENEFRMLCDEFSRIVFKRVLQCEFVPGAIDFLDAHYQKIDMYVISGTPHDEMNEIIDRKKLRKYFKGVYGSPTSKSEWTKSLFRENKWDNGKVIFIGDAMSDYIAARDNDIRFIARVNKKNDIFKNTSVFKKMPDLTGLEEIIRKARLG